MDQRVDEVSEPVDHDVIHTGEGSDFAGSAGADDVEGSVREIEQTRAEMSETIDAIQTLLTPERLTEDAKDVASDVAEQAKDAALEAVDHAVQEAKTLAQEWGELASVAALEAIDYAMTQAQQALPGVTEHAKSLAQEAVTHAIAEAQAALPTVSEHASIIAQETVSHAIAEAKAAVQDLGVQTRAAVRDATVGKVERMAQTTGETTKGFGSRIVTTVKQNPGPAALTGLGLGWLILSGRSGGSQSPQTSSGSQQAGGITDHVQDTVGQVAGGLKDKASAVQDTAGDIADQVQDTVATSASQAQATAGTVVDQAHQSIGQVTGKIQQLPGRLQQVLTQNPVAVSAVALAAGGAAALVIPETQRENQLMGEARDTLIDRAQTSAQDVVQKVQQVTQEAGEAASKEAKYQGLAPEQ